MTLAGAFWPRPKKFTEIWKSSVDKQFQIAPDVKLLAHCLFHAEKPDLPTLLVVHGLEGSSSSPDIINLAAKAYLLNMNVICLNLRNCGDTLHLCPNLYNGGMSDDLFSVARQLREAGQRKIFLVGYSLGGNIVLKLGGELAERGPEYLSGICAVSPAVDLHACVRAIEKGVNRFYELRFLHGLKQKIRLKNVLFPGKYPVHQLSNISSIRGFDDVFTAPDAGYENALQYYENCSSLPLLKNIAVPSLIVAAKDDPLVPFELFSGMPVQNPVITLLATDFGGHGGFITSKFGREDRDCFWAENRVLQFCRFVQDGKVKDKG